MTSIHPQRHTFLETGLWIWHAPSGAPEEILRIIAPPIFIIRYLTLWQQWENRYDQYMTSFVAGICILSDCTGLVLIGARMWGAWWTSWSKPWTSSISSLPQFQMWEKSFKEKQVLQVCAAQVTLQLERPNLLQVGTTRNMRLVRGAVATAVAIVYLYYVQYTHTYMWHSPFHGPDSLDYCIVRWKWGVWW